MKTYDYLNGTDIYLYQESRMFRINTDTTLLGHFYQLKDNESILDIGTNNGALLLFKKEVKAQFCAIDILEDAVFLAKENFNLNEMVVDAHLCEVQSFQHDPFDVIICNPPYFKGDLVNQNQLLKNQRHQLSLSIEDLFIHVKRLLKSNGRFYLVHRASYLNDIYQEVLKHKMRIKTMQFLYDDHKDTARSIVLEIVFSESIETKVLKPIYNKR